MIGISVRGQKSLPTFEWGRGRKSAEILVLVLDPRSLLRSEEIDLYILATSVLLPGKIILYTRLMLYIRCILLG